MVDGYVTWREWNAIWPQGHLWQCFTANGARAINAAQYSGKRYVVAIGVSIGGPTQMYGVIPQGDLDRIRDTRDRY